MSRKCLTIKRWPFYCQGNRSHLLTNLWKAKTILYFLLFELKAVTRKFWVCEMHPSFCYCFSFLPGLLARIMNQHLQKRFRNLTPIRRTQPWNNTCCLLPDTSQAQMPGGVKQYLEKFHGSSFLEQYFKKALLSDSLLIIGASPGDSLIVTGDWLCKVDILVFGDGKLRFKMPMPPCSAICMFGEQQPKSLPIRQHFIFRKSISIRRLSW